MMKYRIMKYGIISCLRYLALAVAALLCVWGGFGVAEGAQQEQRFFDEGALMTPRESAYLEELIDHCREMTGMDVAVVTAYRDGQRGAREYADDFYDRRGMGTGKKASGVLFLIYMDRPGSYEGESYISTSGNMIRILTDERIQDILDHVAGNLRNRDYAGAAEVFLGDIESYVDQGIRSGQYNYDTETGEISIHRSIRWYEAAFAVIISMAAAGSVCMGVKRQYGMEQTGREKTNSLLAYRADAKFAFTDKGDRLVNQFVTSVPVPRASAGRLSGGPGTGSGTGSGRSSTHSFGGGRSHGGGGRRF